MYYYELICEVLGPLIFSKKNFFSLFLSIDWNPQDSSEIAFIKQSGHFGKVSNFLQNVSTSSKVGGTNTEKIVEKTAKDVDENEMNADELTAALFDDADEDENSFSIRQIKKETGFLDDDDDTNLTAPGKEFCENLNCL